MAAIICNFCEREVSILLEDAERRHLPIGWTGITVLDQVVACPKQECAIRLRVIKDSHEGVKLRESTDRDHKG